jgi:deoxyribonuclease IV
LKVDGARGRRDGGAAAAPAQVERVRLPGDRRAGVHLPMGAGLVRVAERASQIGASALQIFSDNPTAWKRRTEAPSEAAAFRARLAELDVGPVAIHAAYLVNLAGPDDGLFEKSVAMMSHEMEHAHEFGASFVNVHVGSHRGSGLEAGVRRLADGLERAVGTTQPANNTIPEAGRVGFTSNPSEPGGALVVLENSSGGGFAVGAKIEELAMVLDAATARGFGHRLGFCLDTAHLWGAGYDVSTREGVEEVLTNFDRLIGLSRLAMVHLNDSVAGLGSRHDRHAHLGEGQIGREGLAHLLCHPRLDHVAFYLETPGMEEGFDAVNVARLSDLATGRPLTQGPATAWASGARSRTGGQA